uniref:Uncharacterized protein n=1 Tax=Arsenophonus nasoniae TaxID=638 RepID=D2TWB0_9GAMM|nr:hypothetical protein ARN_03310 [Arsenophonus nasoniae]
MRVRRFILLHLRIQFILFSDKTQYSDILPTLKSNALLINMHNMRLFAKIKTDFYTKL